MLSANGAPDSIFVDRKERETSKLLHTFNSSSLGGNNLGALKLVGDEDDGKKRVWKKWKNVAAVAVCNYSLSEMNELRARTQASCCKCLEILSVKFEKKKTSKRDCDR